tara:strand:+ start:192 stop:503 length:312 start_codon:yes stop_codon:yes gene_type:complete
MAKGNFSPIPNTLETLAITSSEKSLAAIPDSAAYAECFVRTNAVVETRDGTAPTTSKGKQWSAGDIIILRSRREIIEFQVIREDASNAATMDIEYFNKAPGVN